MYTQRHTHVHEYTQVHTCRHIHTGICMSEVTRLSHINIESQSHILGKLMVPGKRRCLVSHTHMYIDMAGFFALPDA